MTLYRVLLISVLSILQPATAWSAPYTPSSDDVILERLPYTLTEVPTRSTRTPGQKLSLNDALTQAEALLQKARETADPRFYGRIQAILQEWWHLKTPPLAVLKIRADILQKQHHFTESLADIDQILVQHPNDAATLYMQASIYRVLGKYDDGLRSCTQMEGVTSNFSLQLCLESINYLVGDYTDSYQRLQQLLQHPGRIQPSLVGYGYGLLGEIAYAGGHYDAAKKHLRIAQSLGGTDPYVLSLQADLFLQLKEYHEVERLLKDEENNDTLLLRLALARDASTPSENPYADTFRVRLQEAEQRGSNVHLREAAWFYLDIEHDPDAALIRARKNWQTQKEPLDSLLLLRAARAAKQPAAAREVITFLQDNNTEEVHLQRAMQAIKEEAP